MVDPRAERACIAGPIGSLLAQRIAVVGVGHRPVKVNRLPARCGVVLRDHPGRRYVRKLGIGDEMVDVGLRQLDTLGDEVQRLGRVVAELSEIVPFDEVKLHDDFQTAPRRRGAGVHVIAPVVRVDRLGPYRLVICKILRGEQSAVLLVEASHLPCDVAFVKAVERRL